MIVCCLSYLHEWREWGKNLLCTCSPVVRCVFGQSQNAMRTQQNIMRIAWDYAQCSVSFLLMYIKFLSNIQTSWSTSYNWFVSPTKPLWITVSIQLFSVILYLYNYFLLYTISNSNFSISVQYMVIFLYFFTL